MKAAEAFARCDFIPEFADFAPLRRASVGLTGASGVLGGLLAERLQRHGIAHAAYHDDINDEEALADWFAGRRFSHFFHLAARVAVAEVEADPLRACQTNVVGTFNVCRQLLQPQAHPDCWLFHCSTSHVYRPSTTQAALAEQAPTEPPTYYGATKLTAERLVETLYGKLGCSYCIGRVFSYTHARQAPPYLVPSLRERIADLPEGATLEIDNPSAVRDIQDAAQIIDVLLHLAVRRAQGIVNIGSGQGRTVREIALELAAALGRRITVSGNDRDAPSALVADTTRLRALLAAAPG